MHLLILDNRLQNKQAIINSVLENVEVLLLDYENDTFETIHDKKKSEKYDSVAIMQHSTEGDTFQFTQNNQFDLLDDDDLVNLGTFFMDFDSPIIDLLQCALMTRIEWKSALTTLESTTGLNFRASDDNTGNLKVGGNWILESDNVNIKDLYFTEGIEGWEGVLTTDPDWGQLGQDIDGEADRNSSGQSVSLSSDGSIVAIGETGAAGGGSQRGRVRVYKWAVSGGVGGWVQQGENIDGEADADYSGKSVSLSSDGSILAIGAAGRTEGSARRGQVQVFEYRVVLNIEWGDATINIIKGNDTVFSVNKKYWVQIGANIYGESPGDESGIVSLSSNGSIVAIGAYRAEGVNPNNNIRDTGHVRVYKWDGSDWVKQGEDIDGLGNDDNTAKGDGTVSLSNDGSIVAIGAGAADANGLPNSGNVRVFEYRVVLNNFWYNEWDTKTIIKGNDTAHSANKKYWVQLGADIQGDNKKDKLGSSVSLSWDGTTVAIGMEGYNSNQGQVRVYNLVNDIWVKKGGNINGGGASSGELGQSVSLSSDGSIVAVAAPYSGGGGSSRGEVWVYKWGGSDWDPYGTYIGGENNSDHSGGSISLSSDGNIVAIGATGNRDGGGWLDVAVGHVRVFSFGGAQPGDGGGDAQPGDGVLDTSTKTPNEVGDILAQETGMNEIDKQAVVADLSGISDIAANVSSDGTIADIVSVKTKTKNILNKLKNGSSIVDSGSDNLATKKEKRIKARKALKDTMRKIVASLTANITVATKKKITLDKEETVAIMNLMNPPVAESDSQADINANIVKVEKFNTAKNLIIAKPVTIIPGVVGVSAEDISAVEVDIASNALYAPFSTGEICNFKSGDYVYSMTLDSQGTYTLKWGTNITNLSNVDLSGNDYAGDVFTSTDDPNITIIWGSGSVTENSSGGGADPYLYPALSNIPLKLPNKEASYRLFENNNNDVFINASITQATEEHQERMLKFAQSKTLKTHNIICDGYFFDAFHVISEGNSLHIDLKNKKVTFNANTENYFTIKTKKNTTYKCDAFNGYCNKVYISWTNEETGRGYKLATNFFSNPHVENGIELLSADYKGAIGCLVRNYKPKLMELPNVSVGKYKKLHRKLNKAKSKFQSKQIKGKNEVWYYGKK